MRYSQHRLAEIKAQRPIVIYTENGNEMDKQTAKRVDGVYRSIKQLPLLSILGFVIPVIGIMLIPIARIYSSLLSRLLRDYDSGKVSVEEHDRVSVKQGELSTEDQLHFLKHGNTRMWVPYAVGTIYVLLTGMTLIAIMSGVK